MLGCASRCRWLCQVNVHEFYWNVKRRIFPHFRFLLLLFLFHSSQVGIVCIYFVSFCFKRVHNSLYTHYTYEYIYSKIALSPGLTGINNRHTVCVYTKCALFLPFCLFLRASLSHFVSWAVLSGLHALLRIRYTQINATRIMVASLVLHIVLLQKKEEDICKSSQVQVPSLLLLLVISEYR